MTPPERGYVRQSDVNAESGVQLPRGDRMEREIANIRDWMKNVDKKVDNLIKDGCSHRGNDLAKLARIESATDNFRTEASGIKDSIYQLALSFESHKTEVVRSNNISDNKINNLKLGILVQCALLLIGIVAFLVTEFVLPATKNNPHSYSVIQDKSHIDVDQDTWNRMIKDKK